MLEVISAFIVEAKFDKKKVIKCIARNAEMKFLNVTSFAKNAGID